MRTEALEDVPDAGAQLAVHGSIQPACPLRIRLETVMHCIAH